MEKEVPKGLPKRILYLDSKGNFSWTPGGNPVHRSKDTLFLKKLRSENHTRELNEILNSLQELETETSLRN